MSSAAFPIDANCSVSEGLNNNPPPPLVARLPPPQHTLLSLALIEDPPLVLARRSPFSTCKILEFGGDSVGRGEQDVGLVVGVSLKASPDPLDRSGGCRRGPVAPRGV